MARNVEIKARASDYEAQCVIAGEISDTAPVILYQTDTFFCVPSGRLKLRELDDGKAELIFYKRPDRTGPKTSEYFLQPAPDPEGLCSMLDRALGTLGVVKKTRTLFLAGRTRIHFDRVEQLGDFIELEVVLSENEDVTVGERIAHDLMEQLRIQKEDLIDRAYIDFL